MNVIPENNQKAKSQEEIFADLYRQLRAWNPDVPESPERSDPIVRTLLNLYAFQLARLDHRIDQVWDIATHSLVRALVPECRRWPVPAFTVMCCEPLDDVVKIDQHSSFYYKDQREDGQTLFFSSAASEKLVKAKVKHMYLALENTIIDLSPNEDNSNRRGLSAEAKFQPGELYLAIKHSGYPTDFEGTRFFVEGDQEGIDQLRWSWWAPGDKSGEFNTKAQFCPGQTPLVDELFSDDARSLIDWGGLRSSSDLFHLLENHFIHPTESFVKYWAPTAVSSGLAHRLEMFGIQPPSETESYYWIRITLPEGGDRTKLVEQIGIQFNCFAALNKSEQTLFKHTGGNRLVEIELPDDLSSVFEIISVVDSSSKEYLPRYVANSDPSIGQYALEEQDNKLILWFDFLSEGKDVPDSLTVTYSITAGVDANGIAAGKITDLYESHPGVVSAENVMPTRGAIPAKEIEQIQQEASLRLRNRDRVLSFDEISRWAPTVDPRILKAECSNAIQRARGGVRRCIRVSLTIQQEQLHSEDERNLLKQRVGHFLKSRSPVNTHFELEIASS